MRFKRLVWTPTAEVVFSATEVEILAALSVNHYDVSCKRLSKEGGFVYAMQNSIRTQRELYQRDEITVELGNDSAQLLAKCCERRNLPDVASSTPRNVIAVQIYDKLFRLIETLDREWRRANGPSQRQRNANAKKLAKA
jgi:hypothetical protein